MFINLVNTDIPFAEYQLTQDKIDALRFRLLMCESYLETYDLYENEDPCENYKVYLFYFDRKLLFLLVAINTDNNFNYGYPLLRMVDASNEELCTLSDAEMLDVLSRAYELNPDKPLVPNVNLDERDIDYTISQLRFQIVEDIVRKHRGIFDKEFKEEHSLNHYECYDVPERRNVALELSPAEDNEVNRLMHIILKKIYNFDYQPYSDR
ncbi:MAG: hypothetical protein IKO26_04480 [Paludibacteraceae bacterium]|nr:hypothetical protein [Paludibacteraceae bacterium]